MTDDDGLWERVFRLAERGRYSTSPNPRVGAVLADAEGRVVGEGFHDRAGGPHAEIEALRAADARAHGATLYVNLEPCAGRGRTPPCTEALVAAGVRRVLCSLEDPDPRTSGRGIRGLRGHGIEVEVGPRSEAAARLNEAFFVSERERRPFVHLKWASSLDGRTATAGGASKWITGEEARSDALRLREEHDAILVGAGTVLADDPRLTRRLSLNRSIVLHRRIVLSGSLRVPPAAKVFERHDGSEVWLVTDVPADPEEATRRFAPFVERGVEVVPLPRTPAGLDLAALLSKLHRLEARSLLVEGGGRTAWSFLAAGLADRITAYVSPLLLGGEAAPGPLAGEGFPTPAGAIRTGPLEVARFGEDLRVSARLAGRA
ncbi:MAG: bifunctional diaminohydroxyphosphoribosylaminopyrimidine deaminase/5-amino-6-(5-phosphoribosylamino)uracil reductase RibD [Thermoanaerobaculia bacterium]